MYKIVTFTSVNTFKCRSISLAETFVQKNINYYRMSIILMDFMQVLRKKQVRQLLCKVSPTFIIILSFLGGRGEVDFRKSKCGGKRNLTK